MSTQNSIPVRARFVNAYNITFTASTTGTATVAAVDLQLPASVTKQILVFAAGELSIPDSCTINGVAAGLITGNAGSLACFSAIYAGSGPFNVVVTMRTSITEAGQILVYECDDCAPLHESLRGTGFEQRASLELVEGCPVIAVGYNGTDTNAFTWTAPTETFDADVGAYRLSAASNLVPVAGRTSQNIQISAPAAANINAISPLPINTQGIRGGAHSLAGVLATTTAVFSGYVNFNNIGNPELVIAVGIETNVTITGVTFNGNAMTSRGGITNTAATPDIQIAFFSISLTNGAASGNIVVTFSATAGSVQCFLYKWILYGVGGYGTIQTAQATGTGATLSPVINDGGAVLFYSHTGTNVGQTISGANSRGNIGDGVQEVLWGDLINVSGGTKNVGASFASQAYAMAALPVLAA
jgi:hypothetical protein